MSSAVQTGSDAWGELGRLADAPESADARALATALQRAPGNEERATGLAGALRVLVEDPPYGREGEVSALVVALGARVLAPLLLRFSPDPPARRRFVLAAGRNLTPEAAVRVVLAAAAAWDQPCSRPFMEVVAKLTRAAAGDDVAAAAIRALTQQVADRWGEIDPESSQFGYEALFGESAPVRKAQAWPEPERLVELASEVDALTGETWRAVEELVERNRTPELLAILRRAPRESRAAQGIIQHVATANRLKALLDEDPVDFQAVDQLVHALGLAAAEVLLDRLALSQSKEERQPLLERLSSLGPMVASMAVGRLEDKRWFVQANMLALLRSWKTAPREVSLEAHCAHPDARVRREALQLLLEADPSRRDDAIVMGLRDHDPQNVHIVLQAARGACPAKAITALTFLIEAPTTPPFLRLPAIRLLGESGTGAALDALLKFVDGGSGLMGKKKLAAKSPEMLAALAGMRVYRGDKRAAALLAVAEASHDDEIRAAAAGKA